MIKEIKDTLKERGNKYGTFEENSRITQSLCSILKTAPSYTKLDKQHKECFHMIFHKIARAVCGDPDYVDNIHDIIGYSKLLEDYLKKKNSLKVSAPTPCYIEEFMEYDKEEMTNNFCQNKIMEQTKEEYEKKIQQDVIFLRNAAQGKFSGYIDLEVFDVSPEALKIFVKEILPKQ